MLLNTLYILSGLYAAFGFGWAIWYSWGATWNALDEQFEGLGEYLHKGKFPLHRWCSRRFPVATQKVMAFLAHKRGRLLLNFFAVGIPLFVLTYCAFVIVGTVGMALGGTLRKVVKVVHAARAWNTKRNYIPPPLPKIYFNEANGLRVAVRAWDYEQAREWHERALFDGRIGAGDLIRVHQTFLFLHMNAKVLRDDLIWASGWWSDLENIGACVIERRDDIYVPLATRRNREKDIAFLAQFRLPRAFESARAWLLQNK